jgi:predicted NUDIX family NTP pyrophosphohydrolase
MNFSLAAKSFIVRDGKVLVLKRTHDDVQEPGIWELPGGRITAGEDPMQAREQIFAMLSDIGVQNWQKTKRGYSWIQWNPEAHRFED